MLDMVFGQILNPADHHPARITKADKDFAYRLDFKDITFSVKTRDIYKILKKISIGISVFSYENKVKHPIYVSNKCCEDTHVDLLLIGEGEKKMHDHTLHCGRKHFCCYCLQAFRTAEKLKCHIKDCFKINGNKPLRCLRRVNILNSRILEEK